MATFKLTISISRPQFLSSCKCCQTSLYEIRRN